VDYAGVCNRQVDDPSVTGWLERGWHGLHPIIPPLPVNEYQLKSWGDFKGWTERQARTAWARKFSGKTPGYMTAEGYWRGLDAQNYDTERLAGDFARAWSHGAGVGVRGREVPCLDVDVTHGDRALAVVHSLSELFGPEDQVWFRFGRMPKFAVPFRWATGSRICTKMVLPVVGGEKIEVLSWGSQWVLDGVHGGTGRPYDWLGRPRMEQLPVLDEQALLDVLAVLQAAVGQRGKGVKALGAKWVSAGSRMSQERRRAWDGAPDLTSGVRAPEAVVRRAVAAIPNDAAAGRNYEFYVNMLHALKAVSGGEGWGFDAWMRWCARWPYDRPELNEDKWLNLAPGSVRTLDLAWLVLKAEVSPGDKARMFHEAYAWRMAQEQRP
jgi:hypothetical protein